MRKSMSINLLRRRWLKFSAFTYFNLSPQTELRIFFVGLLVISSICLATTMTLAQTEASVWTVDAVKTNEGQQKNYLQFIEQNWAKARQTLKEKGFIKSYRVLSVKPEKSQAWDVLLITEYANREAFEKREEVFAEVFKTQRTLMVNGKSGREMSKIISPDSGYNEPISSRKVAEMINKTEIEAVKIPLENYIKGQATGNGDFIRQAFHKDARITAFRDGKLVNWSVEEFAGRFTGKSADDESKRKRSFEILEISGNAAIARITLDYPAIKFTDYMSLLKIDGEWKIVNKSFDVLRRTNPTEKVSFTVTPEEKKAVALPLEDYFKAQATGNGDLIRQAFHAEAKIMSFSKDKFTQWSAEEFASFYDGTPFTDKDKRKSSVEILDIAGNAAIAKVTLDFPTVKYIDYMTLLKIGGEWKIINKTFYREMKEQPKK